MKIAFVNLYPDDTIAQYLLSSYVLKGYIYKNFKGSYLLDIPVLNFKASEKTDTICEQIFSTNPRIISFSCYIWNIEKVIECVTHIQESSREKITVIFGGPEISEESIRSFSNPGIADYYVFGEGEKKLVQLLEYIECKTQNGEKPIPEGIGVWHREDLKMTKCDDVIRDLDEIPSIYLEEIIESSLIFRKQAFLETQRGCRFKYRYCVYHKNLNTITYYSLNRIFAELDHLICTKQVYAIRIFDSIFTSDLKRAKEIIRHLIVLKKDPQIRIPWLYWEFVYTGVDEEFFWLVSCLKTQDVVKNVKMLKPLDRPQHYSDMLKNYTAINCVGIQSFSPAALKSVNRPGMNLEKFSQFMSMVKKHNIVLKMDIILGLPFETFTSFFHGLEFLIDYYQDTDHILNIHRLQILPGSDLESLVGEYRISYSQTAPHLVYSTNYLTEKEMMRASKLCAILFRILNSPLRGLFFEDFHRRGASLVAYLESLLDALATVPDIQKSALMCESWVDDVYWNDRIYREIPSRALIELLKPDTR